MDTERFFLYNFSMKSIKQTLLDFLNPYVETQVTLFATQAAFFLIISAVPFVMFMLSLVKFIFPLTEPELLAMINGTLPNTVEYYASRIINDVYTQSSLSLSSVSAITCLWAASKCTFALSQGLNAIYRTARRKGYLKLRASAIVNTLLLMIALLGSLLLSVFGTKLDEAIASIFPYKLPFLSEALSMRHILSFVIISALISILYTVLPDKILKIRHQIPGAMFTTLTWLLFSAVFDYYMNNISSYSIIYGVLGSTVLLMIWLQICMIIFLCGAHINVYLYERRHGFQDNEK